MIDPASQLAALAPTSMGSAISKGDGDPQEEFEALFVKLVLQEVRKAMPEDGPMGSQAMSTFQGMFDDNIAKQIAASGTLGLAKSLGGTAQAPISAGVERVAPLRTLRRAMGGTGSSVVEGGQRTSGFGHRSHPVHGGHDHHDGVDLAAPVGTPIRAAKDGTVVFAGRQGNYGNLVVVDHGNGVRTRYAHCRAMAVEPGTVVSAGQPIATVGQTGRTTGPHLHFELRVDGEAVDPSGWLRQ